MKALIVYDSTYGNTEKIAEAISVAIDGDVKIMKVNQINLSALESLDLFFIGCPTNGGRPTPAMQDFLKILPENKIKGLNVAVFDTRFPHRIVKIFGFAADKMATDLKSKGANILSSEGFFVKSKSGPLTEGELERAANWANKIIKTQR